LGDKDGREKDNLTSQDMPTDNNTPGTCALFSSSDFKFVNKFNRNTENASVINMPFQVFHNKQYKISPYLSQQVYN
jgi:hypothetical protein